MSTSLHKIAEASPVVSVPAWLVSIAADVGPLVNLVVGVLTIATLVLALMLKLREWRKKP